MLYRTFEIPEHLKFDGQVPIPSGLILSELEIAERRLSDWQRARLGKITASKFGLVRRLKNGEWGETALSYLYDLVGEHLTGEPSQTFVGSDATQWGNDYEAAALEAYTKRTGRKVQQSNTFLQHPEMQLVGGTPDALCGEKGIVEVKCPFTFKNHLRTVITRTIPDEYRAQVHGHLWLSGRQWCDFVSFDPRIPTKHKHARLVIVRAWNKNLAYMESLEADITDFHGLLLEKLNSLKIKI